MGMGRPGGKILLFWVHKMKGSVFDFGETNDRRGTTQYGAKERG